MRPLIRSLDGDWLASQVQRVVEGFLERARPATETEGQQTAAFLYALDPRQHAAFEKRPEAGGKPAGADRAAPPGPGAVIRLAVATLREAPSGVAQHAIDAALGWSALFVPTSARGDGDAIVHNRETGARTAVAFTEEPGSRSGAATRIWPTGVTRRSGWRGEPWGPAARASSSIRVKGT